jgi:hypothetical protein
MSRASYWQSSIASCQRNTTAFNLHHTSKSLLSGIESKEFISWPINENLLLRRDMMCMLVDKIAAISEQIRNSYRLPLFVNPDC